MIRQLQRVALQSATDCYADPNSDVLACALEDAVGPFGDGLFALLVGGGVIAGLWFAGDGDMATPSVVLIVLGGIIIPMLSGGYNSAAQMVMFLGMSAAVLAVLKKYVMR